MAGSIIIPLLTGFDSKGIKEAETALSALGGKLKSFGRTAAISLGGALAGQSMVNFVKSSVDAAAHLQQNMTGLNTIYGDSTKQIMDFVQAGNKMGMSMADTAKAMTFMGSVFKQTGMPMQDVIEHSKTMVSLGADLAATYGYSVEEALTAMTATFRGEYDPIEKFGVAMKQQQVNNELAARGLNHLTGAALTAAQQQVRYEMILNRTTDAQGAFNRSSGNLVVQMAVLKSTWTDMQALLGSQLVPVISQFVVTLQPLLRELMPHMAKLFQSIGVAILNLLPILPTLVDGLTKIFDLLGEIMSTNSKPLAEIVVAFVQLAPVIAAVVAGFKAVTLFGPAIATMVKMWIDLTKWVGLAGAAQIVFNTAAAATPWGAIAAGVALITGGVVALVNGINDFNKSMDDLKNLSNAAQTQARAYAKAQADKAVKNLQVIPGSVDKTDVYNSAYKAALLDWLGRYKKNQSKLSTTQMMSEWKKVIADLTGQTTGVSTAAVKTWFDNLAEEVKKQTDRLKLQKLGASDAFINSVLGSADWDTVAAKLIAGGKSAIAKFQNEFNKTAAGIDAAKAAADAAAKDLADRQQKYVDAVQKRLDTIKSLVSGMGSFIPKTLAEVNAQVGTFESDVISAADTLRSSLVSALDNKDITKAAYDSLLTYANGEISVMQKLAVARDKVAARIEAAKSVYLEVAQAVRGYGNITATTTEQVTESYMKIIDGVEVTVTRTVDALQNKDLVATYKNVVDKTKAFVAQLRQLKSMGLNATLFKQIIDAGVDAGSATADAIVSGGQDTVNSLNDLFGQLDSAGAQMADMTAQVMENNGVTIVSAFIDGLASEESALSDKAAALGKAFSDAFNAAVNLAIPQVDYTKFGLTAKQAADALAGAGLSGSAAGGDSSAAGHYTPDLSFALASGFGAKSVNFSGMVNSASTAANADASFGSNTPWAQAAAQYNVTVNAGIGTDGAAVGAQVVNVIKQYERNNGSVWVAAS